MSGITPETKEEIRSRFPKFAEATHAFFAKELPPAKYKGTSGKFGCYGEKGGEACMLRLRFPGGAITQANMKFLIHALDTYQPSLVHFTTGEALQVHHLKEKELLDLYQDCLDHDVYCYGAGSDNPRNLTASPLHGVDPQEYFDLTPYIKGTADFVMNIIPSLNLPRKYKISFSNGTDNEGHATFKDLGFVARPDGKVDVYAGGGFGVNGSRIGICVDEGIDPADAPYYVLGYAHVYMDYGDYKNRGTARSRFILTKFGDDEFRRIVREAVAKARTEGNFHLQVTAEPALAKSGKDDTVLSNPRIHAQKQDGLYYVAYHPTGGTPDISVFHQLLTAASDLDGVEIRLNADETAYIINLTAAEARQIAAITESDAAVTAFENSVSCIGATVCQQGLRDSHGMLVRVLQTLKEKGLDTSLLPQCRFSGCASTCTTQQLGALGLRGSSKRVDDKPVPAFLIYAGGNYAVGKEHMSDPVGTIVEDKVPDFFVELTQILNAAQSPFLAWYPAHVADFTALVQKYE